MSALAESKQISTRNGRLQRHLSWLPFIVVVAVAVALLPSQSNAAFLDATTTRRQKYPVEHQLRRRFRPRSTTTATTTTNRSSNSNNNDGITKAETSRRDSPSVMDDSRAAVVTAVETSDIPESTSANIPPPPQQQQQQPRPKDIMMALGTSPRRLFLGTASATGIALAGNFLGVTSQLLTLVPEPTVEATGLDTYFPRGDYRRVLGDGYAFVIPKEWVGDTYIELAKAQRAAKSLDYDARRRSSGTLPDVAFGPPGRLNPRTGVSEQGDTNVSVILSGGLSGFSLKGTLGPPEEAAEKLIRLSLAPPGSGRTITLRSAVEDTDRQVYQLEYDVDRGERGPPLRAISVIAAGTPMGTKLITMTVTAPKANWESNEVLAMKLERIASSFHTR